MQTKYVDGGRYRGPISSRVYIVNAVLVLLVAFGVFSYWYLSTEIEERGGKYFNQTKQALNQLSQVFAALKNASENDLVSAIKVQHPHFEYIQQISIESNSKRISTSIHPGTYDLPHWLEAFWVLPPHTLKATLSSNDGEWGTLSLKTHPAYIRYQLLADWLWLAAIFGGTLLLVVLVLWSALGVYSKTLRALVEFTDRLRAGERELRLAEVGTGEVRWARRAINDLAYLLEEKSQDFHNYRTHMEKKLSEITEDTKVIEGKKKVAEVANHTKSQYLSNISQEIRAPLASIVSLSEMMMHPEYQGQQRHFIDMVHASAVHLQDFADGVLDIACVEQGEIPISKEIFEFRRLISAIEETLRPALQKRHRKLEIVIDNDLPLCVVGDVNRVRQVLLSLVSDLLHFNPYNTVVIKIQMRKADVVSLVVAIQLYCEQRAMVPEVVPVGGDLSNESAYESLCRVYGDTGLSLVITRILVGILGGTLEENSHKSQPHTYAFDIHLGRPSEKQIKEMDRLSPGIPALAKKSLRILLAESHMINRYVFELVFFHRGHVTIKAANGADALQILKTQKIDFAVIDFQLPELDGLEVVRLWRSQESGKSYLPIIMMTTDARSNVVEACKDYADFVEVKPVSPYKIIENIDAYARNPSPPKRHAEPAGARKEADSGLVDFGFFGELRSMSSPSELSQLFDNFYASFEDDLVKLRDAMQESDLAEYRHIVVKLATDSQTVGAIALQDKITRLQTMKVTELASMHPNTIRSITTLFKDTRKIYQEQLKG